MVWCGVVWHGVTWYNVVWCGVTWYNVVWRGVVSTLILKIVTKHQKR